MKPTEFRDSIPLSGNDLCRDLSDEEKANLQSVVKTIILETNEKLFAAGEFGDNIYMVISGEIDIRLPTTKHHYKRLATCNPGSFFGELALLNPGPRVADAVATHKTELLVLDQEGLKDLTDRHPDTAIQLLTTLARIQVEHLRWSTSELQRLSEW